jgi:glycosyltransferase involved in cell wall biosynthesis
VNNNEELGVSVVIPAYNGNSTLEMCVVSVLEQDFKDPLEIIVVDDCSKDSTLNIAEHLDTKVITHVKNVGLAASINDGVKNARFSLVLILHQDCVLRSKKWISTMVSELLSDATVGVVSSPTFIPENVFNSYSIWEKVRASWMQDSIPKMLRYKELDHGIYDKCDLFAKKVFEDVGLFDDTHYRTFMEDSDMTVRLRHANYGILYVNIPVEHWDGWGKQYGISRSMRKMYEANSASGVQLRRGELKTRQSMLVIGKMLAPIVSLIFLATQYWLFAIPLLLLTPTAWAIRIHRRRHDYKLSLAALVLGFVSLPLTTYGFLKGLVTSKQK